MQDSFDQVRNHIKKLDPNANLDQFVPTITHEEAVQMSLSRINEILPEIMDLEYKILSNTTSNPIREAILLVVLKTGLQNYIKDWKSRK